MIMTKTMKTSTSIVLKAKNPKAKEYIKLKKLKEKIKLKKLKTKGNDYYGNNL